MAASPDLRAAVVGAGEMGRHHIRALGALSGVQLVAIADGDPASLEAATRGRTVEAYADAAELFERERPDFAVVAVPTLAHEAVASAALRSGVNVLIEKPVAPDLEAAERLRDLAAEQGLLATVGHIERFNPAIRELRARLAAGDIGRTFQVVARRTGPFPSRVKDVGVIKDLATHDLDVIRYVTGSPFEMVSAQVAQHLHEGHEDLASILGRLADGTIAVLDVNWLTPQKTRDLRVVGEGGMLVADYLRQDLTLSRNGQRDGRTAAGGFTSVTEGEVIRFTIDRTEPLAAELSAFAQALREQGPPPVPIDEAAQAILVAERALESASLGAPVEL